MSLAVKDGSTHDMFCPTTQFYVFFPRVENGKFPEKLKKKGIMLHDIGYTCLFQHPYVDCRVELRSRDGL